MSDLTNAPAEVLEVHNAMMTNARERFNDEDMEILSPVYTREEESYPDYKPNGKWLVGCNFEGHGPSMLWDNNVWSYRYGYKEDQVMKGGKAEALSNASIFFTG